MREFTDLEICKKIADIDGKNTIKFKGKLVHVKDTVLTMNGKRYYELTDVAKVFYNGRNYYDPLNDNALLMKLIKKYISKYRYDVLISPEDEVEMHYFTSFHGNEVGGAIYERAALIAIIEAHS